MALAKRDSASRIETSPAVRWPAPPALGSDVAVFDHRARDHAAEEQFPAVRVLLAEGEKLVRAGLRELLEEADDIAVAGEATSGREAVAMASEIRPDVVLVSVRLPDLDGVEATRRITAQAKFSQVRVLILGADEREEGLLLALQAGASGALTRDAGRDELLGAVRVLAGGGVHLSPQVTRRLIAEFASRHEARRPRPPSPEFSEALTAREQEVVALVAWGLSNDEIAGRLGVSAATVKTHAGRAMVKLHAHDRARLAALAHQLGLAQPRDCGGASPGRVTIAGC